MVLLLPVMAIAWVVCGFLIYELIPGLTYVSVMYSDPHHDTLLRPIYYVSPVSADQFVKT